MRRLAAHAILLAALLAGCAAEAIPPALAPPLAFGAGEAIDDSVPASEPDLAVLPDGTLLACGVGRGDESDMRLWRRPPGEAAWAPIEPPGAPGLIDCAWSVDAGGRAYFATSAGRTLTLATTRDGAAWDTTSSVGDTAAVYDRPWIAGGGADRAVAIAFDAVGTLTAWATRDGGASWEGPFLAQQPEHLLFQAFSNLAWLGGDAYAYAYGRLEPSGAGVEPHDLWVATTNDAGRTWTAQEVAPDRGNLNNVFPSIAANGSTLHVAWAESGEGGRPVRAFLLTGAPGAWQEPVALHGPERTALMPRVLATSAGPLVAMYAAEGEVQPSIEEASWDVIVVRGAETVLVAEAVHEGTVATGGYGALLNHVVGNAGDVGTANSQELLHNLGVALQPDGRAVVAWAGDAEGMTLVYAAAAR